MCIGTERTSEERYALDCVWSDGSKLTTDDAPKGHGKHGGGDCQADEGADYEFNGGTHG